MLTTLLLVNVSIAQTLPRKSFWLTEKSACHSHKILRITPPDLLEFHSFIRSFLDADQQIN